MYRNCPKLVTHLLRCMKIVTTFYYQMHAIFELFIIYKAVQYKKKK
jgi:hypothetical protein